MQHLGSTSSFYFLYQVYCRINDWSVRLKSIARLLFYCGCTASKARSLYMTGLVVTRNAVIWWRGIWFARFTILRNCPHAKNCSWYFLEKAECTKCKNEHSEEQASRISRPISYVAYCVGLLTPTDPLNLATDWPVHSQSIYQPSKLICWQQSGFLALLVTVEANFADQPWWIISFCLSAPLTVFSLPVLRASSFSWSTFASTQVEVSGHKLVYPYLTLWNQTNAHQRQVS